MSDNGMIYDRDLEKCVEYNDETMANGRTKKHSLCTVIGGLLLFGAGVIVGIASNSVIIDEHGVMNGNERQLHTEEATVPAMAEKVDEGAKVGSDPVLTSSLTETKATEEKVAEEEGGQKEEEAATASANETPK